MSLALMPPKVLKPRTVEQILGPEGTARLVAMDLQHRQQRFEGGIVIEVHYDDSGKPRKWTSRQSESGRLPLVDE